MIESIDLKKTFGRQTVLKDLNVHFASGQVVSFIGPNGSGKTTFLKCILGLVKPDSGKLIVQGNVVSDQWQYRQSIGYMPQIGRYPDHLKVRKLFEMIQEVRGTSNQSLDYELFEAFKIANFEDKAMRTLSGGMRQKVSAALALMFNPDILILDEPTAGLDPLSTEILKEKLQKEKAKGKLMLITSHVLSDLEDLTTHVMYLMEGNILFHHDLQTLTELTGADKLNKSVALMMRRMNPEASEA